MFTALSRKSHANICTTFSPTDNSCVKVQRGKTVAASITGKPLYPPVILHIIRMSLVCQSYVLYVILYVVVCHSHITRMSFVYHLSVLVCHSYTINLYLYANNMSLVCHSYVTRMSIVCTCMSFVCHSYVFLPWTVWEVVPLSPQCIVHLIHFICHISSAHSNLSLDITVYSEYFKFL